MAGIYLHIPFCRQACHYCDFHFSTNLELQDQMVSALAKELQQRSAYLQDGIDTIYFGGGTPSLLSKQQLERIMSRIRNNFKLNKSVEITLEANPEDLTAAKCNELIQLGINRLSIGVQTFDDEQLLWMNRAHAADQVTLGFNAARAAGFSNISLDLIYAFPNVGIEHWKNDLSRIVQLDPEHISLYGLTIEDRTVFGNWEKKGKLAQIEDDEAARQYLFAIEFLTNSGYLHYEVSNFGKEGFHSHHNHSYWSGVPYLGVGPGAHSFNGSSRTMNIRNNPTYIKAINEGTPYAETEVLSTTQLLNERILTSLRTSRGLSFDEINTRFKVDLRKEFESLLDELVKLDMVILEDEHLRLQPNGFLVADEIALRMFFPE